MDEMTNEQYTQNRVDLINLILEKIKGSEDLEDAYKKIEALLPKE